MGLVNCLFHLRLSVPECWSFLLILMLDVIENYWYILNCVPTIGDIDQAMLAATTCRLSYSIFRNEWSWSSLFARALLNS